MNQEDKQQVKQIIQDELSNFIVSDRYVFQKHIQLFDGKNIQIAKGTGTQIGTEITQKLSFYGVTPVDQPITVANPSDGGPLYNQTQNQEVVNAVNGLIARLKELGLIA
jgi:hypothetical protein